MCQLFFNFINPALHIKIAFGHVVVFAIENFLEGANGFGDRHLFADSSLTDYDEGAATLLLERVRRFLDDIG